jgi:hypothetical protein
MKWLGIVMVLFFAYTVYGHLQRKKEEKIVVTTRPSFDGLSVTYIQYGDTITDTMSYADFEIFLK